MPERCCWSATLFKQTCGASRTRPSARRAGLLIDHVRRVGMEEHIRGSEVQRKARGGRVLARPLLPGRRFSGTSLNLCPSVMLFPVNSIRSAHAALPQPNRAASGNGLAFGNFRETVFRVPFAPRKPTSGLRKLGLPSASLPLFSAPSRLVSTSPGWRSCG